MHSFRWVSPRNWWEALWRAVHKRTTWWHTHTSRYPSSVVHPSRRVSPQDWRRTLWSALSEGSGEDFSAVFFWMFWTRFIVWKETLQKSMTMRTQIFSHNVPTLRIHQCSNEVLQNSVTPRIFFRGVVHESGKRVCTFLLMPWNQSYWPGEDLLSHWQLASAAISLQILTAVERLQPNIANTAFERDPKRALHCQLYNAAEVCLLAVDVSIGRLWVFNSCGWKDGKPGPGRCEAFWYHSIPDSN